MEYRGINIEVHRERFFTKVPIESGSGRTKDSLTNETSVRLHIFGDELHDISFIFELRAILDEFISKRLSQYSKENILNTNQEALGDYSSLRIHRDESFLIITVEDACDGTIKSMQYNMIHAKTLSSILSKAIQYLSI